MDLKKAVQTLRHEFIDYCITSVIVNPLIEIINLLIKSKEAEVYRQKEKIADLFSSLL